VYCNKTGLNSPNAFVNHIKYPLNGLEFVKMNQPWIIESNLAYDYSPFILNPANVYRIPYVYLLIFVK